jgi:hypothetical protein
MVSTADMSAVMWQEPAAPVHASVSHTPVAAVDTPWNKPTRSGLEGGTNVAVGAVVAAGVTVVGVGVAVGVAVVVVVVVVVVAGQALVEPPADSSVTEAPS